MKNYVKARWLVSKSIHFCYMQHHRVARNITVAPNARHARAAAHRVDHAVGEARPRGEEREDVAAEHVCEHRIVHREQEDRRRPPQQGSGS